MAVASPESYLADLTLSELSPGESRRTLDIMLFASNLEHAGDIIQYGDPSGRVHTYRVSYTTIVSNTQLWPLGATSSSALTLQTCWTWDGSRDFIVRALEI